MDENRIAVVVATPEGEEFSLSDGEAGTWVYMPVTLAEVQQAGIPLEENPGEDAELRLRCYVGQAPTAVLGVRPILQVFGVEYRVLDVWVMATRVGGSFTPATSSKIIAQYLMVRERIQSLMLAKGGETLAETLDELQAKWERRFGLEVAV